MLAMPRFCGSRQSSSLAWRAFKASSRAWTPALVCILIRLLGVAPIGIRQNPVPFKTNVDTRNAQEGEKHA